MMSISPSTVFLNEDLDNADEILEELVSSNFISDEPSSSFFDILSSPPIDLDLQCEDDDIDYAENARIEDVAGHTMQMVYNFNSVGCSSSANADCYEAKQFISPICLAENQSPGAGSHPVQGSTTQIQISFPVSHSEAAKSSKKQNIKLAKKCITCRRCSIQFSSKKALLVHHRDKHVKKEILLHECTLCHVNFKSKPSLARHAKIHKEKQGVKCGNYRISSENCIYSCETCPYMGKTRTLLREHIRRKHSSQQRVYSCEKCQFSCLQERSLTLHIQRHEEDPKFACDQCGKLFHAMSLLKRHAHTHSKTRTFQCQFQNCGKSFSIKGRLTDHIRTVHKSRHLVSNFNNLTVYAKDKDYSHLEQSESILFHDYNQANTSKPLQSLTSIPVDISHSAVTSCDICVYDVVLPEDQINIFNSAGANTSSFGISSDSSSKALLNKNMNENQTSFLIDSKAGSIKNLDSWKCNVQRKMQKRKFVCTWEGCDKKFRDNYNLYVHRCTHTGEMQRACSLCRYRCVQKSAMDAHMKTHNIRQTHGEVAVPDNG